MTDAPVTPIRRVILIAAGRGKRLGTHTEEVPKCMVEIGGIHQGY